MPFTPGKSGNPNGRPHKPDAVKNWSQKLFDKAGRTAIEHELQTHGPYWFKCAELVLAYAYGKPTQPVEQSGTVVVEHVDRDTVDHALDYAAQRRRLRAVS